MISDKIISEFFIVLPSPRATSQVLDSPEGSVQDAFGLRRSHFAMPKGKLVLQMPQAGGDPRGQGLVRELRLFGGLMHQTAPGEQFIYPVAVLVHRCARILPAQMLGLPSAEGGADFVPILHGGAEVSQDPSLEIGELADFNWQRFCRVVTHSARLASHASHSKTQPS